MTNIRHGLLAVAIAVGATFGAAGAAAWNPADAHLADVVGGIFGGGGGVADAGSVLGNVGGIFGGGGGAPSAAGEMGSVGGIFGGGGG